MSRSQGTRFAEKGGWWAVLQSFLMLGVLVTGPLCQHERSSTFNLVLASVFLVAGALYGIAGVLNLGRSRTIFPKPLPQGVLVQTGIYAVVRHPLYSSLIHLGFGWALLWHCGATLVLTILLSLVLYCKSIKEEAWLRDKYPAYSDYEKRVKRFVPGLL